MSDFNSVDDIRAAFGLSSRLYLTLSCTLFGATRFELTGVLATLSAFSVVETRPGWLHL